MLGGSAARSLQAAGVHYAGNGRWRDANENLGAPPRSYGLRDKRQWEECISHQGTSSTTAATSAAQQRTRTRSSARERGDKQMLNRCNAGIAANLIDKTSSDGDLKATNSYGQQALCLLRRQRKDALARRSTSRTFKASAPSTTCSRRSRRPRRSARAARTTWTPTLILHPYIDPDNHPTESLLTHPHPHPTAGHPRAAGVDARAASRSARTRRCRLAAARARGPPHAARKRGRTSSSEARACSSATAPPHARARPLAPPLAPLRRRLGEGLGRAHLRGGDGGRCRPAAVRPAVERALRWLRRRPRLPPE